MSPSFCIYTKHTRGTEEFFGGESVWSKGVRFRIPGTSAGVHHPLAFVLTQGDKTHDLVPLVFQVLHSLLDVLGDHPRQSTTLFGIIRQSFQAFFKNGLHNSLHGTSAEHTFWFQLVRWFHLGDCVDLGLLLCHVAPTEDAVSSVDASFGESFHETSCSHDTNCVAGIAWSLTELTLVGGSGFVAGVRVISLWGGFKVYGWNLRTSVLVNHDLPVLLHSVRKLSSARSVFLRLLWLSTSKCIQLNRFSVRSRCHKSVSSERIGQTRSISSTSSNSASENHVDDVKLRQQTMCIPLSTNSEQISLLKLHRNVRATILGLKISSNRLSCSDFWNSCYQLIWARIWIMAGVGSPWLTNTMCWSLSRTRCSATQVCHTLDGSITHRAWLANTALKR